MDEDKDKILLVFSDVEMGAGGPTDDFPQSDFLGRLILSYNAGAAAGVDIDLVFNGDTFDLLKTSFEGRYTHFIDRDVAVGKMARIAAAHGGFFAALREFLAHKKARRTVHFIVGNHDAEILFPEVQDFLYPLCGTRNRVYFSGFEMDVGEAHIEHGSQRDPLFRMEPERPFLRHDGKMLLNVPWGMVPILDVVLPYQSVFYHLDRVKPRGMLFEKLPEMKEWLVGVFWKYWTQDFLRDYFRAVDPFKKVTWALFKEVVRRFTSLDPDVSMGDHFQREMRASSRYALYLVGHKHEAAWWSYGRRKIIQTGCFRNEFMISDDAGGLEPIPKTYAEVFLKGQKVIRSHLVEVAPPPLPEGYIPRPLSEFKPVLAAMLGSPSERERRREEIVEQERREPGGDAGGLL